MKTRSNRLRRKANLLEHAQMVREHVCLEENVRELKQPLKKITPSSQRSLRS